MVHRVEFKKHNAKLLHTLLRVFRKVRHVAFRGLCTEKDALRSLLRTEGTCNTAQRHTHNGCHKVHLSLHDADDIIALHGIVKANWRVYLLSTAGEVIVRQQWRKVLVRILVVPLVALQSRLSDNELRLRSSRKAFHKLTDRVVDDHLRIAQLVRNANKCTVLVYPSFRSANRDNRYMLKRKGNLLHNVSVKELRKEYGLHLHLLDSQFSLYFLVFGLQFVEVDDDTHILLRVEVLSEVRQEVLADILVIPVAIFSLRLGLRDVLHHGTSFGITSVDFRGIRVEHHHSGVIHREHAYSFIVRVRHVEESASALNRCDKAGLYGVLRLPFVL